MALTWPGVPVTAWASIRPWVSKTPAERSPASLAAVEKAVRIRVWACSSTMAIRRFHMIWFWISERAEFLLMPSLLSNRSACVECLCARRR